MDLVIKWTDTSNYNAVRVVHMNPMDVRFRTPANYYICGQSQSGKSHLVRSMLDNLEELFYPVPTKILYCYGEHQK